MGGTHEIVTPVTLVCSRWKEGRKTVFSQRTCPRSWIFISFRGTRWASIRDASGDLEKELEYSSDPVSGVIDGRNGVTVLLFVTW